MSGAEARPPVGATAARHPKASSLHTPAPTLIVDPLRGYRSHVRYSTLSSRSCTICERRAGFRLVGIRGWRGRVEVGVSGCGCWAPFRLVGIRGRRGRTPVGGSSASVNAPGGGGEARLRRGGRAGHGQVVARRHGLGAAPSYLSRSEPESGLGGSGSLEVWKWPRVWKWLPPGVEVAPGVGVAPRRRSGPGRTAGGRPVPGVMVQPQMATCDHSCAFLAPNSSFPSNIGLICAISRNMGIGGVRGGPSRVAVKACRTPPPLAGGCPV